MKISDSLIRILIIVFMTIGFFMIFSEVSKTDDLVVIVKLYGSYFMTLAQIILVLCLLR